MLSGPQETALQKQIESEKSPIGAAFKMTNYVRRTLPVALDGFIGHNNLTLGFIYFFTVDDEERGIALISMKYIR